MSFHEILPSSWNSHHLLDVLSRTEGKKILVIGDVGVDRYTIGSVERISPEAPVPIVCVQEEKLKLGLAANVADNVQALGAVPYLVGVVGEDRGADDFRALLGSMAISSDSIIVDPTRRTVIKERVVSERQQLVRIDYESPHHVSARIEKQVLKKVKDLLPEVEGVILEDYSKGLLSKELARAIFKMAKKEGLPVAVDPNIKTSIDFYKGATILTPNTKEAEALSGVPIRDLKSLQQAGKTLLEKSLASHVVITRGKEGMAIFSKSKRPIRLIPTYAREVYDVSGAGDTVISVLILALVSGASIEEAAVLGNLAAGVEVGKRGTATVSREEIRLALEFFQTV